MSNACPVPAARHVIKKNNQGYEGEERERVGVRARVERIPLGCSREKGLDMFKCSRQDGDDNAGDGATGDVTRGAQHPRAAIRIGNQFVLSQFVPRELNAPSAVDQPANHSPDENGG